MLNDKPLKEFKIFQDKFTWTKTKIINGMILTSISICVMISFLFHIENSSTQTFLLLLSFILYLIGVGFKLSGFNKIKQLQGHFSGTLIFQKEYIAINKAQIKLDDLKKIEIKGVDWYGLRTSNYVLGYNYENGLSNGTNNFLYINYKDDKHLRLQFQQSSACEFSDIEDTIKHYYANGKIGYLNCVEILCMETEEEKQDLKKKHYS